MLYRVWLLFVFLCVPIAYWSIPLFVLISFIGLPLAVYQLICLIRLPLAPRDRADKFRNIVIAHRGGQAMIGSDGPVFPENSLAAFRWCSSDRCGGADAFEIDVWLSKDGVPMINHDAVRKRTHILHLCTAMHDSNTRSHLLLFCLFSCFVF